jgi:carbamoyltransferase
MERGREAFERSQGKFEMNVLGIAHDIWISSAALLRDGEIVSAVCEERLNRQKKSKAFPGQSIDMCLEIAGLGMDDLDLVVCGWNPAQHLEGLHSRHSGTARFRPEYLYAVPNYLLQKATRFPLGVVEERFTGFKAPIVHVDHQLAHAANAFFLSPFDSAAVLTADGRGERQTALFAHADSTGIHPLNDVLFPHSLGLFYGMITQYLGFVPDNDEWKVMALAAYGSAAENKFYPVLRRMFEVREDGSFRLDLSMCGFHEFEVYGGRFYTQDFVDAVGIPPRRRGEPIRTEHHDLAWALQQVFEEVMTAGLIALAKTTEAAQLVLADGCMMNSVYNGKITSCTPFTDVFVSSCPDDSGISVGAAFWGYHEWAKQGKRVAHEHNYWGPGYDHEIEEMLKKHKIPYVTLQNPSATAARLISEGKLVGWFQGRMEFGQRALGNRSILADPRKAESKTLINDTVKYREPFRPFAPAILADRVGEYFEVDGTGRSRFMERVYKFRDEVKQLVPAVVHADGTGRLQTVERESNARFYDLIAEFNSITGVPIVLNTSFNLNKEPIVCTPVDAIRTFYSCGLDVLIMGDCLITK